MYSAIIFLVARKMGKVANKVYHTQRVVLAMAIPQQSKYIVHNKTHTVHYLPNFTTDNKMRLMKIRSLI